MVEKVYNVQRVSDGKTYQTDGTWGQGNNYDFTREEDVVNLLNTQETNRWRLNILYKTV